jgi:hypothetical protein
MCGFTLCATEPTLPEGLRRHYSIMPHDTCEALNLAQGASYADGAAAVLENRQMWADHFAMIFRAQ